MKILYLVRHAKSSWKHDLPDHKRPLKKRGRKDAALVSQYVKDKFPAPQFIFTSDATRARSTAKYFRKAFELTKDKFSKHHQLYDFSGQEVMQFISEIPDKYDTVMLVGHNHAFTSIVNMLGDKRIDNVPTCGFVAIQFKEDQWNKITNGKTVQVVFPKQLKQ